jgi:hypothetical protein
LAAYNLRFNDLTSHDHLSSSNAHCHHNRDNFISFLDLKVPDDHQLACRRYGAFPKPFVVVPSTLKLASCSGGHDISTIADDIFPGLYCVANVVHSDQRKVDNGSAHNQAAAGSALFKAKCSRSNS